MMTNNHVRLFFGWSDAFVSHCRHKEEPRHWGVGGGVRSLSVSSGPFDSSLWADGGASAAGPVAEAASAVAVGRHGRRGRCDHRVHRVHCGRADAETGAAPGSWHAAALASSSKCLS